MGLLLSFLFKTANFFQDQAAITSHSKQPTALTWWMEGLIIIPKFFVLSVIHEMECSIAEGSLMESPLPLSKTYWLGIVAELLVIQGQVSVSEMLSLNLPRPQEVCAQEVWS